MSNDSPDEPPVGPGNPPKEHRWKKGCPSPNPAGRPPNKKKQQMMKKPEPYEEMVLRLGAMPVRNLSGEEMTLIEGVHQKVLELAIDEKKPNLKALAMVIKMHREAYEAVDKLRSEAASAAFQYKDNMKKRLEHARKTGIRIDDPVPHPDDIIVTRAREILFVGPQTDEEYALMKKAEAHCEVIVEQTLKLSPGTPEGDKLIRKLHRVWVKLNDLLPPRLRKEWAGAIVPRRPRRPRTT